MFKIQNRTLDPQLTRNSDICYENLNLMISYNESKLTMHYFGETAFEFGSAVWDSEQDILEHIFFVYDIFNKYCVPERLDWFQLSFQKIASLFKDFKWRYHKSVFCHFWILKTISNYPKKADEI